MPTLFSRTATLWLPETHESPPMCWRFLCSCSATVASLLSLRARADTPRVWWAALAWAAFLAVQALDGTMSYIGVQTYGHWIEGNPLVAWYASMMGPAMAFTAVKLFAVACGSVLYLTARHHWVALLTAVYLVFAIGPWLRVLTSGQV